MEWSLKFAVCFYCCLKQNKNKTRQKTKEKKNSERKPSVYHLPLGLVKLLKTLNDSSRYLNLSRTVFLLLAESYTLIISQGGFWLRFDSCTHSHMICIFVCMYIHISEGWHHLGRSLRVGGVNICSFYFIFLQTILSLGKVCQWIRDG